MLLKDEIKEAIVEWEEEELASLCNQAMNENKATAVELLNIIGDIMAFLGKEFEKEEIYLPDLIGSANCVKKVIINVLDPAIRALGEEKQTKGKVVIGTVESDVHSIGKDLVASFLFSNGYEVFNLGVDVPAKEFVKKAEEVGANVIAMSSLLTMSMDFQKDVINELEKQGVRDRYKVIVGGSPTSEEWADTIGADGWADDAIEAVSLVNRILS